MKESPILFSTPMVQAILPGNKTMTRRVVKPRTPEAIALLINLESGVNVETSKEELIRCFCPYGQVGDRLWVRETWMFQPNRPGQFYYKASQELQFLEEWKGHWSPSIHMPRAACRLVLEITGIRVERLQDINEEDAKAEGVYDYEDGLFKWYGNRPPFHPGAINGLSISFAISAKVSFESLWVSINGPGSWADNPWVWVIEFKKIEG